MTRVLVVSADQEDPADVAEGSLTTPATLRTWLASGPYDIDALILDLPAPEAARAAVAEVRQRGLDVPVVLVAGETAGWDDPDLRALPRCVVLPSPVDPQVLRDAVNSFQGPGHEDVDNETGSALLPAGSAIPPLEERVTEYRVTRRPRRGTGRDQRAGANTGAPPLVPIAAEQHEDAGTTTAQARDGPPLVPDDPQDPRAAASVRANSTSPLPISAIALVRALLARVSELDGVATTSEVVVKGAADRTGADASVVLLPDQGRWRVAGGLGLRPVETRFELPEDSWLVQEIALASRGMIIQDTDIARSRLRGAPLASWRHLMAAPMPRIGAAVLVARKNDPPFDEASLRELVEVAEEADPLLAAALDVRSLARMLDGFRDQD